MQIGEGVSIPVRTVVDLLDGSTELVMRAADALTTKASTTWSRHIFLLLHPFDGIAAESFENFGLVADRLPEVNPALGLDSLWLLFHSLSVTARWSSVTQQWTNMLFSGWSPDDGPEPDGLIYDLQDAEELFLDLTNHERGSPWMFGIRGSVDGG